VPDDLGAGGDLARDGLLAIGVEQRDRSLGGQAMLLGVELEHEEGPDRETCRPDSGMSASMSRRAPVSCS
jgi:hypothetical protein